VGRSKEREIEPHKLRQAMADHGGKPVECVCVGDGLSTNDAGTIGQQWDNLERYLTHVSQELAQTVSQP
jgi:hypothetical protein